MSSSKEFEVRQRIGHFIELNPEMKTIEVVLSTRGI